MSPQPLAVPLKVFIFKIAKCDEYTTCGKCIRSDIVVVVFCYQTGREIKRLEILSGDKQRVKVLTFVRGQLGVQQYVGSLFQVCSSLLQLISLGYLNVLE